MTLRGRILPIGGLREKTFAAFRHGMKHVILPIDNQVDMDEIDPMVKEALVFHFVHTFDEIPPLLFREQEQGEGDKKICEMTIIQKKSSISARI